jgi:hypothetical protein
MYVMLIVSGDSNDRGLEDIFVRIEREMSSKIVGK